MKLTGSTHRSVLSEIASKKKQGAEYKFEIEVNDWAASKSESELIHKEIEKSVDFTDVVLPRPQCNTHVAHI